MKGCRQEVPPTPQLVNQEIVQLRINLIEEEITELLETLYAIRNRNLGAGALTEGEKLHVLTQLADAIADVNYVVDGTAVAFGLDGEAIFNIVHAANMEKLGGPIREDGKQGKPPGWQKPEPKIMALIAAERMSYVGGVDDPNRAGVDFEGPL